MIRPLFIFSDWGILILRVALSLIILNWGFLKIRNLKASLQEFKGKKFKWLRVFVFSFGEFFGGLMLLMGFLTQVVAFFIALGLLVIIFKFKAGRNLEERRLEFLMLAIALCLFVLGGGGLSLDEYWLIYLF